MGSGEGVVDVCDAEILDELTTSRGELKHRSLSLHEDRALQDLQVIKLSISIQMIGVKTSCYNILLNIPYHSEV